MLFFIRFCLFFINFLLLISISFFILKVELNNELQFCSPFTTGACDLYVACPSLHFYSTILDIISFQFQLKDGPTWSSTVPKDQSLQKHVPIQRLDFSDGSQKELEIGTVGLQINSKEFTIGLRNRSKLKNEERTK